jgi:hypothetical protein
MMRIVLAAALALQGCGLDETQACTVMRCFSGLRVTLTTPPAEAYRVRTLGLKGSE